ncbi:MAG: tRNA (N(6)-L-threonylcarbamoyladenosine(37)-C(2))-methylthiotransferase MtaB [Ezakiella sp.]|uniref:tRNA (N(6)-L-threonylcarbamoyladenosine(37)-C(2))- methylthiotransferase MtaB n=1 Tax=Ezakiella sp. TaxID=1935205 RepID=UPI00297A3A24|nr:tRNA (N(6)-L-threonylcarbamoyladenosine(37)-C(2))-methylthiotransferase MtaB [Ezakiella sp.]MDD7731338.1 tRNA (N(6)-L-threonylcarbamoyladenosine(37)-C(2))-methylthiotransferase MtaB [Eubacteriales bacterium]MDY6080117.1 tRNA (N(6)-L-threonylcarbamoyladenosine(37)-C(2))-methylthiotransferase MtaB [Ezakiella sp.]
MKVKIKTLGCKVNFVESLALEERLRKAGFEIVDSNEEICDIFILNSCSVTNESDKKSRQALSRNRKMNPDNYSVIMGCYSQVSKDELLENKNVNLVVGNKDKLDISYLMNLDKDKGEKVYDISKYIEFEDLPLHGTGEKTRGFIKIEDGCDNFCSYCIIPFARGRVRSRSIESIKKEATSLGQNAKEIVITGIEVASYGKDLKDVTLIDAIEAVHEAAPNVRIRLSSLEISVITDDFLRRLKNISQFCDQFHLSLQSGSDNVLKAMNRKYNKETFKKKVDLIRTYYPNSGITTDIIVGFPGETEEDHESTVQYLKDLKLSRIHIFPYSIRKGTKAADMEQVDGNIKIRRKNELEKLGEELQDEFKNSLLNKKEEVLIEERTKGFFTGYTRNYVKAEISCDEYPDLKLNSVVSAMLVEEKGEKKWIVCSAK